ncbi:hypothetical protein B5F77_13890 [Parabacteroides sp. An277]|uniref:chaperone modulator CbpM n=1 Tax=Parabacteroides sp. An277 TaxID=1965619 RepID=UPI000B37E293|nr:chaperone modulator CbpM [Parabacteroides sp. An277]OUO49925.1 hypothetical protein B5F77_13890 [Parabacteroides sp. An277]
MNTNYIIVSEYCEKCHIDPEFILLLDESGLVDLEVIGDESYLPVAQLKDVEQYTRMYYDLSINMEGIDAIRHLLKRIESLQEEVLDLKERLRLYE